MNVVAAAHGVEAMRTALIGMWVVFTRWGRAPCIDSMQGKDNIFLRALQDSARSFAAFSWPVSWAGENTLCSHFRFQLSVVGFSSTQYRDFVHLDQSTNSMQA